ncbi:MAG: hypothetical protein GXO33_04030 [Epsilonproteobacteria bacterium]|nr:hypothetical protein [Campylobacterota bacterium]
MKKRYDEILEAVVLTFLRNREPIGSASLRSQLPFEISAATIRYYFNKMVERGELAQLHKSSGRIPTERTMKQFWRRHLGELTLLCDALEEVEKLAEEERLFVLVKPVRANRLRRIERVSDRYLILVFEEDEYIIRYQAPLESFLRDLIGYELEEVKQIARDVGMMSLFYKMRAKSEEEVHLCNPGEVIRIASEQSYWGCRHLKEYLEGDAVETFGNGIHFDPLLPRGFMALRTETTLDNRPVKLLCLGAIDHNFTKLFKMEVHDGR